MRDKFELACKIIGLLFFVAGIFVILTGIVVFLFIGTMDQIPPSSKALMTQSQIAELQDITNSVRNRYALAFLFAGILEMIIGFYLMKSKNIFLKLCYPFENKQVPVKLPPDIQLEVKSNESQVESKESSENKYAPPGYFEK